MKVILVILHTISVDRLLARILETKHSSCVGGGTFAGIQPKENISPRI